MAEKQDHISPEFSYHLLRHGLQSFGKNLTQLDAEEYAQVYDGACKSYELESLVLAAPEAEGLVITSEQLDHSVNEVASRYSDRDEFSQDLQANGLDEAGLRHALQRELMFDAVMQRVSTQVAGVSDVDARLYYEMHLDKFTQPELRTARHILITVNPEYPENTRGAALARMEQLVDKLAGRANRFSQFAQRHSECPTAMEGGKLGEVKQGQLYPELDAVLFSMQEGEISSIIESEMGFHILLCEKIKAGKRVAFAKVEEKIRALLEERQRRSHQKEWLNSLRNPER